jgi:hypothetical protein
MSALRWEYGGEFHLMPMGSASRVTLPEPSRWYALGRHALSALAEFSSGTLWVPCYFCPDVTSYWARQFHVVRYCDTPDNSAPDWGTLQPKPSDLVLAVDFFGVRDMSCWSEWRQRVECILVEDYTHDVACPGIETTQADYAFASLRKTLAIPEGAVLWSPRGLRLPFPAAMNSPAFRLQAMALKAEYITGRGGSEMKRTFRQLQLDSENQLRNAPAASPSAFTMEALRSGVPADFFAQRRQNVQALVRGCCGNLDLEPLFKKWPEGATPYAVLLKFRSQPDRNSFRSGLRDHQVYCPIHWEVEGQCSHAADLASRLLTIPADHRYTSEDVQRVMRVISNVISNSDLQQKGSSG